jgi:hypothetical protein
VKTRFKKKLTFSSENFNSAPALYEENEIHKEETNICNREFHQRSGDIMKKRDWRTAD